MWKGFYEQSSIAFEATQLTWLKSQKKQQQQQQLQESFVLLIITKTHG